MNVSLCRLCWPRCIDWMRARVEDGSTCAVCSQVIRAVPASVCKHWHAVQTDTVISTHDTLSYIPIVTVQMF